MRANNLGKFQDWQYIRVFGKFCTKNEIRVMSGLGENPLVYHPTLRQFETNKILTLLAEVLSMAGFLIL